MHSSTSEGSGSEVQMYLQIARMLLQVLPSNWITLTSDLLKLTHQVVHVSASDVAILCKRTHTKANEHFRHLPRTFSPFYTKQTTHKTHAVMADTKKDEKKPTTQQAAPGAPAQQQAVSVLEEDDEFEEFENGKPSKQDVFIFKNDRSYQKPGERKKRKMKTMSNGLMTGMTNKWTMTSPSNYGKCRNVDGNVIFLTTICSAELEKDKSQSAMRVD